MKAALCRCPASPKPHSFLCAHFPLGNKIQESNFHSLRKMDHRFRWTVTRARILYDTVFNVHFISFLFFFFFYYFSEHITELEYIICDICNRANLCNDDKTCSYVILFSSTFFFIISYFTPRALASMFAERPILYNQDIYLKTCAILIGRLFPVRTNKTIIILYKNTVFYTLESVWGKFRLNTECEKERRKIYVQHNVTLCILVIEHVLYFLASFVIREGLLYILHIYLFL